MSDSFLVEPARSEELATAFRLIFRYLDDDERELRVANALDLASTGELNLAGVLIARQDRGILGAMVCQPAPGATALFWPPQAVPGPERIVVEDSLVRHACVWFRRLGTTLGQALLDPHDVNLAAPLERNGFRHITSLSYMRHKLDLPGELRRAKESLTFQTYKTADPDLFHSILLRTYEQTLDCPEINNVRTIDDIIAGHQAQGKHAPERWWFGFDAGRPVCTLLLNELPEGRDWDLSYLGVVPEARGRGVGRQLVRKALYEAWSGKAGQLSLSVDTRNLPAHHLYQTMGFEPYDHREVFLIIFGA